MWIHIVLCRFLCLAVEDFFSESTTDYRMADQRTELEFDEFEKLLGEIPNATLGNSHPAEAGTKSLSLNGIMAPTCVTEKLQTNGGADGRRMLVSKLHPSPIKRVQLKEAKLPDDQSLSSAFAELSFTWGTPSGNCKSSTNNGALMECECVDFFSESTTDYRMADQRTELEFDEFEKLLGEIPNATLGNSHPAEAGTKSLSLNGIMAPTCVTEKLQTNGGADGRRMLVSKLHPSPIKRVQLKEAKLPDDQSLSSAFAELSFTWGTPSGNCKSSTNNGALMECECVNNMKKSLPNTNPPAMVAPFQTPNNVPCVFDEFKVAKGSQEHSDLLKLDSQGQKISAGYCQPRSIENYSNALPLSHGVQGFQFFSNMNVPGLEFPFISDQQQYFADVQSQLPYLRSQQLNQPHISWRNIEDEQYYRMHQQCLYMQQLHNQQLEAQVPIQANGNAVSRSLNQNARQGYFEVPIAHQPQEYNQDPYWNNFAATRCLNLPQNPIHVLDKVERQSFPEKILTRSQGLNTLKALKFGSMGSNEAVTHLNWNRKFLSNGLLHHSLSAPSSGCYQLDDFSSWNLLPDVTYLKGANLRTQYLKYSLVDEVAGKIYLMAKDQHGCRFLQRKFSEGTPRDVEKIFVEIIDHIVELMTDPFGNYLLQKLLEVCDEDQRMQILCAITRKPGELVRISCDMHGTRAVQKVIETLKTPEQFSTVVSSLKPGIMTLIKNMNGNHVAQRCLQYLLPEYSEFLFEAIIANCIELATDRHGCCVLQKCLSHSEGDQRRRLVSEITSNALILSQDPFGNYVVQFVLELQLSWAVVDTLEQLDGNYGELSVQKYSSNVVEKCLKHASEERRDCIIWDLINNSHFDQIMQDPYGNYVIQAALQLSKGAVHAALVEAIRPHVPVLRTRPYGKKVLCSYSLKK